MLQIKQRNVNRIHIIPIIIGIIFLIYFFTINSNVISHPQALSLIKLHDKITSYEYSDSSTNIIHYAAVVPEWHGTQYRMFVIDNANRLLPLEQEDNIFTAEETIPDGNFQIQYRAIRYGAAIDQYKSISLDTTGQISAATYGVSTEQQTAVKQFFTPETQAKAYITTTNQEAIDYISKVPQSIWLLKSTPNLAATVTDTVQQAAHEHTVPIFTLYNASRFNCDSYASNKAVLDADYQTWIKTIADAIGENNVITILEPDALAQTSCIYSLPTIQNPIAQAVQILKSKPNILVYIDAGHPNWISSTDMASRLKNVNIAAADGFSLNVSNFISTPLNIIYGISISQLVNNKHFIIDTSRNGVGAAPDNAWCNPPDRGLGTPTTSQTPHELVDALIWIKNPGESDGTCNGGPSEGVFWPDYAIELYKNRR